MSDTNTESPHLDRLRSACEELDIDNGIRLSLFTSPLPEALFATAIICRAALKGNRLFHVSTIEPTISGRTLFSNTSQSPAPLPIIIGARIVGADQIKPQRSPVLLGSTTDSRDSDYSTIGSHDAIPMASLAFSEVALGADLVDLPLAAAGAILQHDLRAPPPDSAAHELISLAQSRNSLIQQNGLRIYGANTLPIAESLYHSIAPYLSGISGDREICNSIVVAADIPLSKRSTPASSLTPDELQNLTFQLIQRLDSSTIADLIGPDYTLVKSHLSPPMHLLSQMSHLLNTSWTIHELGVFLAVLIGDHGSEMRSLQASHLSLCRNVLKCIQRISADPPEGVEIVSTASIVRIDSPNIPTSALSSVARIIAQTSLLGTTQAAVVGCGPHTAVAWQSSDVHIQDVLLSLHEEGVSAASTSKSSIIALDCAPGELKMMEEAVVSLTASREAPSDES